VRERAAHPVIKAAGRIVAAVGALVFLVAGCTGGGGSKPSAASSTTTASRASVPANAGIHKIRHVVVIMQENRSFDSYFGTYP